MTFEVISPPSTAIAGHAFSRGVMPSPSPLVSVHSLSKYFRRLDKTVVPAIDDVSVDVLPGEFVVLLGPSGCGKTTLLRCIAGLEEPDRGVISLHGRPVYDSVARLNVAPERRSISMIFQSYALWPHLSAFDNVGYPLRSRGVRSADIAERVHQALRLVGIPELARQFPGQMSGGQQQRVALARAIVANDRLVLFDEPLSNVDAKVREQLRLELAEMQHRLGFAAIYVTHDQTEALALANRIVVLQKGRIAQVGSPRDLYNAPASRYVANFVGTSNELAGTVRSVSGSGLRVSTALGELDVDSAMASHRVGEQLLLVIRPERVILTASEPSLANRVRGVLEAEIFLGPYTEYVVRTPGCVIRAWSVGDLAVAVGQEFWLSVAADQVRAVSPE